MCSLKCALLLLLYNALLTALLALKWGMSGAINFEASFLGFLGVLLAGYRQLETRLKNGAEIPPKFSAFILGLKTSFGFLKLGAYALFLFILFYLLHTHAFMPKPYLLGLGTCLVGVLVLQVLRAKNK